MTKSLLSLSLLILHFIINADEMFPGMLTGSEKPLSISIYKNGGKCLKYQNLTILTKLNDETASEIILVKKHDLSCKWDIKNSWLINEGFSNFYYGKWKNLIFIDHGTGPSERSITILNLFNHNKIFKSKYADPIEIKDSKLTFWKKSLLTAEKNNCRNYDQIRSNGFTPQLQNYKIYNLTKKSYYISSKKHIRCDLVQ